MFTSTPFHRDEEFSSDAGPSQSLLVRQSVSRNRQSYAYPLQQAFEEARSFLDGTGVESIGEPSEFEVTLGRNRRKTMGALPIIGEEDYISVMENLHPHFGIIIQSMTDRSQIFEVVHNWVEEVGLCLLHQKTNQTDISDTHYRKLQSLLRKESETWDLIRRIYFERLNVEEMVREPFSERIKDRYFINETPYIEAILSSDPALREMHIALSWLESNFVKNDAPDLSEKNFIWENTLDALRRDKLLNKPTSKSIVSTVDPDAPTREGKQLHPLDDEENNKVLRGAFFYLRTGDPENAITYLAKSGDKIKAAALSGFRYTGKDQVNPDTGEQQQARGQQVVQPSTEYLPRSKRQAKPNPDFEIYGNPKRDLWKNVTWKVCEKNTLAKYDRALLGSVCGHREAMLGVAQNWEDRLWAFLKASLDVSIEANLRNLSEPNDRKELPDSYWTQKLSVAECIEKVEAFGRPEPIGTPEFFFQYLQKCALMDDLEGFLEHLLQDKLVEEVLDNFDHALLRGHLIRFITHLLLFFGIVNLPFSQELMDSCLENYIGVLVDIDNFIGIPFYVQKLSDEKKIPIIVHHVNPGHQLDTEKIIDFLKTARENDLDILKIGTSIVDKLRDEEGENFNVENLNWIACSYEILEKSPMVMYELLKFTIWLTRKFLTLGDVDKVRLLIGRLSSEHVGEVTQLDDALEHTLIREYLCYKVYLDAEDALTLWKKALAQKPSLDNRKLPANATAADRLTYNTRRKEFESIDAKWRKSVDYHLNTAIEKFSGILEFPLGWLRDCYDAQDEDEAIHVGSVRRLVIKKVVHILLRLIKDKNDNRTVRDFLHVVCDEKKNILTELAPEEIGNIFKVVEQFTRENVTDLMFLPK